MANHRHDNPNRLSPKTPSVSPAIVDGEPISLHTGYGNGLNKLTKAARQSMKAKAERSTLAPMIRVPAFITAAVNRVFFPGKLSVNPRPRRVQAKG